MGIKALHGAARRQPNAPRHGGGLIAETARVALGVAFVAVLA
jgi:hypothetical protein